MKNIKNRFAALVFFALLAFPATVLAEDYAQLNFIGFSADGKYLAFEQYGTQDGSGFPYANIYFVETDKNAYAAPPVLKRIDSETATETQVRRMARTAAAANLKKFRIVEGNTGKLIVARLLTDLGTDPITPTTENKNQTIEFVERRETSYTPDRYALRLATSEIKTKNCDYVVDPILTLTLTLKDETGAERVLQKDEKLPDGRGCAHAYSIERVYVKDNRLAVFLNVFSYGFEGYDMRYLVVTGNHKK